MAQKVSGSNWDQGAEQPRVNGRRRSALGIQMKREKPNRDMQDFARDFMPVNKGSPVPVDGDKPQGARRPADITPVGGRRRRRR